MQTADLAIIGGGAAGLAAAIFAAETAPQDHRIVILDGAKTLGAKILVSGGGRCNVTHQHVAPGDFNGSQKIVRNILSAFDERAAVRWFASMRVELKQEPTGKLFPVTDSARTVLNALLERCRALGVVLQTNHRVTRIIPDESASHSTNDATPRLAPAASRDSALYSPDSPHFTIESTSQPLRAPRIILCTGGRSLPRTGSDGAAWEILRTLGHAVTPTYAALVPLVLAPQMFHAELTGIAQEVELSTFVAGKRIDHRTGSLLWTHFGISGPVVMDASRHWTMAHESGESPVMKANLLPGETFEQVEAKLIGSLQARPRASMLTHLCERFSERVARALLRHVQIDPATVASQLSRDARRALVHAITALVLPVTQHRGWNYAEVTAGGVPLNEIDFRTMQSRKVPGLYLAGETLDCDGRIGGFNFQWAWATGYLAGRGAATANRP